MGAAQKTKEFVEAAALRVKLRCISQVPFADRARRVSGCLEPIRDRRFRYWQSDLISARATGALPLCPLASLTLRSLPCATLSLPLPCPRSTPLPSARVELMSESRLISPR
jgi:hypothetical protein